MFYILMKKKRFICLFLFLSKKDRSLLTLAMCYTGLFFFAFLLFIVQKYFVFIFFRDTYNFFGTIFLFFKICDLSPSAAGSKTLLPGEGWGGKLGLWANSVFKNEV